MADAIAFIRRLGRFGQVLHEPESVQSLAAVRIAFRLTLVTDAGPLPRGGGARPRDWLHAARGNKGLEIWCDPSGMA